MAKGCARGCCLAFWSEEITLSICASSLMPACPKGNLGSDVQPPRLCTDFINQKTQRITMIVWLASYPRSGNTFFRIILHHAFGLHTYSIHYDDKYSVGADSKFSDAVGHRPLPSGATLDQLRADEKLWPIKTHHPYPTCAKYIRSIDKIIYIVRDGRESTLSYCHYLNQFTGAQCELQDVILGHEMYGSWANHVQSWLDSNTPRLMIKYEALVQDTDNSIQAIKSHFAVDEKEHAIPTFQELRTINPHFFRSGQSDSWKTIFTKQETELFWLHNGKTMIECGYTNDLPTGFDINNLAPPQCRIPIKQDNVPERLLGKQQRTVLLRKLLVKYRSLSQSVRMEAARITNTNPIARSLMRRIHAIWPFQLSGKQ